MKSNYIFLLLLMGCTSRVEQPIVIYSVESAGAAEIAGSDNAIAGQLNDAGNTSNGGNTVNVAGSAGLSSGGFSGESTTNMGGLSNAGFAGSAGSAAMVSKFCKAAITNYLCADTLYSGMMAAYQAKCPEFTSTPPDYLVKDLTLNNSTYFNNCVVSDAGFSVDETTDTWCCTKSIKED